MKKNIFTSLLMIAIVAMVGFTSCEKEKIVEVEKIVEKEVEKIVEKEDTRPLVIKLAEDNAILLGNLKQKLELKADVEYNLTGNFIVEEGGELHIPAGTVIKANEGFANYILVAQGGKIFANGTAEKPVTMTSISKKPAQGAWGGLIINGRAPITDDDPFQTEINSDYKYGGNDPKDNSGVITYLKLEYTGARASADIEHNGLTLNGVGSGTKIENLYIPYAADDAIEFFGGSVNVTNLLVVDSDDDMFDFTQGYTGTLKNCYGIWQKGYESGESDPRGIEADGNHDGNKPKAARQSDFTVENMTIDLRLDPSTADGYYMHDVIKVRRGAKATIINALVKGQGQVKDLVDLTDKKGDGHESTTISLTNSLTTPFNGKEVNGTGNVTIKDGNTGCPTNIFAWTGYKF